MEERALFTMELSTIFVVNFPQHPGALREFMNNILGVNDDITRLNI